MTRKSVMVAATEFRDGASGSGLIAGFRQLGWLVQSIDRRAFSGSSASLALRAASRLTRVALQRAYQEAVWHECEALRPDVFFTVKGAGLSAALLERIQSLGTKTVMYYPDVSFDHPGIDTESFSFYDCFVTTKSFQLEWLIERLGVDRVAHVPHGYSESVFQPIFDLVSDQDFVFDVLYMGNHSPYKQRWLERLIELHPGLNLGVAGGRWREQASPLAVPSSALMGEVRGVALAKLIQTSRINIALHFGNSDGEWQDLVSTRTFEIPACKGFMLHIDNPEVRSLFSAGEEVDVFSSPEELDAKVRLYLANPAQRRDLVERAYSRAVPAYGYACRAAEIDRLIRSLP